MPLTPAPTPALQVLERSHPGRRSQLKRDILLGALACFNEHGLDLTTIEMVRARCDTSVGNIYHHFGNKDGLIAALFFAALEDQHRLLGEYLARAQTAREGVEAVVGSYVDWVDAQPELARFLYQARSAVAKGPQGEELTRRNRARNRDVFEWLAAKGRFAELRDLPSELIPALLIGPAESYSRAWLSGRAKTSPRKHRQVLAQAAWRSLSPSDEPSRPAPERRTVSAKPRARSGA